VKQLKDSRNLSCSQSYFIIRCR